MQLSGSAQTGGAPGVAAGESRQTALQPVVSTRGLIFDRAGRPLVANVPTFTVRDGYPRKIPDKGTYWHMGQEVKTRANRLIGNTHPELLKPKPKPRPGKGDVADRVEKVRSARSDAIYRDSWGVNADGRRSIKAKKTKPQRKTV
jgi:cell division protein FtsI/penicillin-binding protein 2